MLARCRRRNIWSYCLPDTYTQERTYWCYYKLNKKSGCGHGTINTIILSTSHDVSPCRDSAFADMTPHTVGGANTRSAPAFQALSMELPNSLLPARGELVRSLATAKCLVLYPGMNYNTVVISLTGDDVGQNFWLVTLLCPHPHRPPGEHRPLPHSLV